MPAFDLPVKEKAMRTIAVSLLFTFCAIAAVIVAGIFVGNSEHMFARLAGLATVLFFGSGAAVAISSIVRHLKMTTRTKNCRIDRARP